MSLDLFKIENELAPQKGLSLIAEPLTDDDYFGRSVVLLAEHGLEGSVGFVLNKKTNYLLSDLVENLESDFIIYKGGPVEPNALHYIHTLGHLEDAIPIEDGLFWGGDFEQLKDQIKLGMINDKQIQFFMGYSGWSPDQLEHELNDHFWIVSAIDKKDILLKVNDRFWTDTVKALGDKFRIWLNVPENPNYN